MQIVRNEFVVAFEIVIGYIEEDGSIFALGAVFQDSNRKLVAFEQRRKQRGDEWLFEDLL